MSNQSKSQWDFGELFPSETTRRVLTVSELTTQVKRLLEKELGLVWVTGEVTNLRVQSSGHIYFTLKDPNAQLNCVLFRGEAAVNREVLQDGQKLLVQGDLTVYEPRGQYQLIVRAVELQGAGALQLAFERLKRKLQAEGLFAPERKRPLPKYPQRIGLVTSPTGAAIRDVLHVIQRRNPNLEIIFVPCRVQGDGAAAEIASAIRRLNEFAQSVKPLNRLIVESEDGSTIQRFNDSTNLDLVLVTRGGGSLEDLWAFNEEVVARAVFESAVPVVSAIGHEIDFTISDFVADVRAATPSAAAEIITEGVFASRQFVAETPGWMGQRIHQRLGRERENLEQLSERIARSHPSRRLNEKLQLLDDLQSGLLRGVKYLWRECRSLWHDVGQRLLRVRPGQLLERRLENWRELDRRLCERTHQGVKDSQNRFVTLEARLRLLSPTNVLERGYSVTFDAETGQVIRDATEVKPGQRLKTRLKKGEIRSVAEG
ncbi:MAG TPA: exodeoxyribonuclease VII large subunit [Verrucomicrobiae bacterium]|nr:exodeoxyribonuclease VII large subunit [Verrucomicrobiae bacterium]